MPNPRRIRQGKLKNLKEFIGTVYSELIRTRVFVVAAALAFYSLLSLIPLLMMLSALVGYLPIPHLFDQMLTLTTGMLPAAEMAIVQKIVSSLFVGHRGSILSIGLLGYLWSATGGFAAAIEALDIAYDVPRGRTWWRDRLQAMLLILTTGSLNLLSIFSLLAGPHLGRLLTVLLPIPLSFARIWPIIRLTVTFVTFVFAVETLFYLAPNRKQSLRSTLPGAVIAVIGWVVGSFGLNLYFAHFSNYAHTYGSLGTAIVLMLWLYMISFFVLTGAEANAELVKSLNPVGKRKGDNPFDRPIPGVPAA